MNRTAGQALGPRKILQREEAYCRMLISSPCLEDCYNTDTSQYQIKEVKCFVVPRVHRTAIDGFHHDAGHQGKKRTGSLISD